MSELEKGVAEFQWFNHPLIQAGMWGALPLYEWQSNVLSELAKVRSRVVVSTCNESGKTNVIIPIFGLSLMAAFPGATIFSTAGSEEQIKGQLWKYLDAKVRPYRSQGWACSMSDLTVQGPEIRGLRSRWVGRSPRDALTMEGYHGAWERDSNRKRVWCPVAVILDEAKSLDDSVFQAAWRIDPDWLLVISTPGDDEGPFFDALNVVDDD